MVNQLDTGTTHCYPKWWALPEAGIIKASAMKMTKFTEKKI